MLVVPLQHRGRVLGVYSLLFAGSRQPPAAVMAMLKSVGELLGLALDNARLEAQHLQATLLRERQAMAAEVHDSVAQSLTFIKMRLPLLHDAMHDSDVPRMERYYDDVREAITQAHSSLRNVLTHLRMPMDPLGLHHALQASVDAFQRSTGVAIDFADRLPDLRLAPEQELNVHHVVREALANVARHAAAHHAWVQLSPAGAERIELVVEDDGSGLPAGTATAESGSHYGLATMRERARRIDGVLEIGPREGGGTRVRLHFPAQTTGRHVPGEDGP
jgi:two-component system nitrate/nitrite sensor histidine kinase NarX